MFTYLSTPTLSLIGALLVLAAYLVIAIRLARKKLLPAAPLPPTVAANQPIQGQPTAELIPRLIDKPADHPSEQAGLYSSTDGDDNLEMVQTEHDNQLLKAAERVVEDIQAVVDAIIARPANPDEVYTQVRAIVSQYTFFEDTEYYEAINSFVSVTLQRECDLTLTPEELHSLWLAPAA